MPGSVGSRRSSVVVRQSLAVLVLVGLASAALAQPPNAAASAVPSGDDSGSESVPEHLLGPNGEVPEDGISDDEVKMAAVGLGIALEDARYFLFEGSGLVAEYTREFRDRPEFGALYFDPRAEGSKVVLRLTRPNEAMVRVFESRFEQYAEQVIGGDSATQLSAVHQATLDALMASSTEGFPAFRITSDHEAGVVELRIDTDHLSDLDLADTVPRLKVIHDTEVRHLRSMSYAGATRTPTCTIGFALRAYGLNALATAAHCSDSNTFASGGALGTAFSETCANWDRQLHVTPTAIYHGFYAFSGAWKNIENVAAWYAAPSYFLRVGKNTKAVGDSGPYTSVTLEGGDCGVYPVSGFGLSVHTNVPGSELPEPGDSGGPVFTALNGKWYLSGLYSGASAGGGGFAAWRSIPTGWTVCTRVTPCTSWP